MKKLIDFQHFGNISTDSKSPVFFLSGLIYPYILTKNSKVNKTSNFFEDFWCRKQFFWVATTTDFFEPIFVFLRQFCFEKHRSATWSRMGMFSELSGQSALGHNCRFQSSQCSILAIRKLLLCMLQPILTQRRQIWHFSYFPSFSANGKMYRNLSFEFILFLSITVTSKINISFYSTWDIYFAPSQPC